MIFLIFCSVFNLKLFTKHHYKPLFTTIYVPLLYTLLYTKSYTEYLQIISFCSSTCKFFYLKHDVHLELNIIPKYS